MNTKMEGKDYITCGIFSAISLVVLMVAAVANITPYTALLYTSVYALLNGVVFLLLNAKVPKRGMIVLFSIVPILFFMVRGWENMLVALSMLVFALLAELIIGKDRLNMKRITIAYVVYTAFLSIGGSAGMFLNTDVYCDNALSRGVSPDMVEALRGLLNYGTWAIMIAATAVASVLGIYLGRSLLKKHLKKAGLV